ncbi:CDF1 [Arabidopsis thaliana]|uniref:CDF1 n=1 Tax=Arabidopsis thaliana TaxID=3702 RepID=A0A178UCL9_ARATH|nr:CDF1 [Arabidopsis thaliana]
MLESKDPAIKLFGMKIPFPTVVEVADEEEEKVLIIMSTFLFLKELNMFCYIRV